MKVLSQTITALAAAAAVLVSMHAANAQAACAPHGKVSVLLDERYGEQVVGRGLAPNGRAMFELYVSASGSWTVLASDPNGRSCVIASGENWERSPLLVGDPA